MEQSLIKGCVRISQGKVRGAAFQTERGELMKTQR